MPVSLSRVRERGEEDYLQAIGSQPDKRECAVHEGWSWVRAIVVTNFIRPALSGPFSF